VCGGVGNRGFELPNIQFRDELLFKTLPRQLQRGCTRRECLLGNRNDGIGLAQLQVPGRRHPHMITPHLGKHLNGKQRQPADRFNHRTNAARGHATILSA